MNLILIEPQSPKAFAKFGKTTKAIKTIVAEEVLKSPETSDNFLNSKGIKQYLMKNRILVL